MPNKILFTGGGTAGHVTANLALIAYFLKEDWQITYLGSSKGIEKRLLARHDIPFYHISSGKLRRYFSWNNFTDPFKIVWGIVQAFYRIHKIKPDIVFSKGGFVAVPVVIAAWLHRVPVVAHESDFSPGLANRLCFPFVKKICVNFETARDSFSSPQKAVLTGTPIRAELFQGDKHQGLKLCGFHADKPVLLVMGGSLGAGAINDCLRAALDELSMFQIIHICGEGKLDVNLEGKAGYQQFAYVEKDLAHLFACTEVVVSRSGANALFEILALHKPNLLIPLSRKASRGDQIQNAAYFQNKGVSHVLYEENLSKDALVKAIKEVYQAREVIVKNIKALAIGSATEAVIDVIKAQMLVKPNT